MQMLAQLCENQRFELRTIRILDLHFVATSLWTELKQYEQV